MIKLRQATPDDWRRNGQEGQSRKSGRPVGVSAGEDATKRGSAYRRKSRANRSQSALSSEESLVTEVERRERREVDL